jgi:hypothetical protein
MEKVTRIHLGGTRRILDQIDHLSKGTEDAFEHFLLSFYTFPVTSQQLAEFTVFILRGLDYTVDTNIVLKAGVLGTAGGRMYRLLANQTLGTNDPEQVWLKPLDTWVQFQQANGNNVDSLGTRTIEVSVSASPVSGAYKLSTIKRFTAMLANKLGTEQRDWQTQTLASAYTQSDEPIQARRNVTGELLELRGTAVKGIGSELLLTLPEGMRPSQPHRYHTRYWKVDGGIEVIDVMIIINTDGTIEVIRPIGSGNPFDYNISLDGIVLGLS